MTLRRLMLLVFAAVIVSAGAPPSLGEDAGPLPPFQAYVDMKTFMEHVLTPAAAVIWRVNAIVIDEKGEHDLSPKSEAEWEQIESGAATLAEATNALMIPQRALDAQWNFYAGNLAQAASKAFLVRASARICSRLQPGGYLNCTNSTIIGPSPCRFRDCSPNEALARLALHRLQEPAASRF